MECSNCGWGEITCDSCHSTSGLKGWVNFSQEEIEGLLSILYQCHSEGYFVDGDPAFMAVEKLHDAILGFL